MPATQNTRVIRNTFEGGMVHDAIDSLSPNNTYKYLLNGIDQSRDAKGFGVVNEESNFLAATFPASIVGHSHIDEWDATLVFCSDGSLNLFYHANNQVQFVCRDSEFGCKWDFEKCEFLYGEFKSFNACNELHVYWSSNCVYHVVNINEMLDAKRKAAVIACEDCSYFDIFKVACKPHYSVLPVLHNGSAMEGGAVQFSVQLEDNDGNQTNWFDISQPAYVETPDNIAGQPANGGVRLNIDGLDPKYDKVNIAVIKTTGNVTTVEKMKDSYPYGTAGVTFDYYGQKGEVIDLAVITTKRKAFLRGQDLLQKDGRMLYYNIKNERNVNYQKYANSISVNWVEYEVSLETQKKYKLPTLMRGEVYAFGVVLNYADGTHSDVFHIPGGGGGGAGGSGGSNTAFGGVLFTRRRRAASSSSNPSGDEGSGGSGGGGGGESGGASDSYSPVMPSQLDTEDQLRRRRNPSEVKDRPQESDMQEEFTLQDIMNIDTQEQHIKDIAECAACTRECWCCDCNDCNEGVTEETQNCTTVDPNTDEVIEETTCVTTVECAEGKECNCDAFPDSINADIDDFSNTEQNNAELLALYGRDYPDPPLDQTGTLRDAAVYLQENAVIEREYITRKKPTLGYGDVGSSGPGGSPTDPSPDAQEGPDTFGQQGTGTNYIKAPFGGGDTLRGDNWTDQVGNNLIDEPPRFVGSGGMQTYVSTVLYPDSKDCEGNFFYPQGPVRHHRVPWASERPHFRSTQNGVENQYQPANDPYGNTFIRCMGAQFTGITRPSDDELPKPLCPNSWFKIVYVKRSDENKSVFAKGWCSGIFTGESYGKTYAFPRHGVNSFEHVDRFCNPDSESRFGAQSNAPMYTFHSPDTDANNGPFPVTKVHAEGELLGSGWRYGLYAEGKRPKVDQWAGTRVDNRGARVANNINHLTGGGGEFSIAGIGYVKGNTVGSPISGISLPLMNKYRESAMYMQTSGALPGSGLDRSFQGDVMDHFCPTTANAPYVALYRDLPDQYGSVESLRYAELGINATKAHAGGVGTVEGICGDAWVGPFSKRRTSYVSNKVGNFYHPPPKEGSPCRERSICESPDDKIFEVLGIDHYPTKIPLTGDLWDPRNYCGLHTVAGNCGEYGLSKKCPDVPMTSETDFYWPRVLKSLVHTVVESHVNPWLLETGEGPQIGNGAVYYPKLKDLNLDSHAPVEHPWEESFLSRFYCEQDQPSVKQIAKKSALRTFIHLGLPALGLTQFQELESVIDGTTMMFIFPMLAAMWMTMANTLFTDRRLNQMFRIGDCKRDEEGGDLEECITNWEDAYARYNSDYSKTNTEEPFYAFPSNYNTCDCLHEDTCVLMADHSRKRIKDIKVGEEVKSFDTEKGKYVNKKVLNVWDKGELDLFEITFSNHEKVKASIDHEWFVRKRLGKNNPIEVVSTRELMENPNKWYVLFSNNITDIGEKPVSPEMAYILGIYIAEGSIPSKRVGTRKKYTEKFFISQFKEHIRDKIKLKLDSSGIEYSMHEKGFYLIDTKELYSVLLKVPKGALNKKIPEEVFRWDKSLLEKVYEGLMDGDGHRKPSQTIEDPKKGIINSKPTDIYYTASIQLLNDVKLLSWIIGRPMHGKSRGKISGFGSDNEQYRLYGSHSDKTNLKRGKLFVRSIEPIGKDKAIDIEVEDTNSFILADSGAISHNCDDCDKDTGTNNEIYHSNKQNLDSEIDAYRNVGINAFNEIAGSAGKMRKLFKEGPALYAHMTDGIYVLKLAEGSLATDIGSQLTGTGELYADPVLLFEGSEEGFLGTNYPNGSISVGGWGRFFVDDVANKIYRFTGKPEEVSVYGMQHFFKENLEFCQLAGCYDEKTNYDTHFALGWDPRYNRLLVTKYDQDQAAKFTASYSPMGGIDGNGKWIGFHSYIPQSYIWDRNEFYSVVGNQIWQHHKKDSYGNFYGNQYNFMIQCAATNDKDYLSYRFKEGMLNTEAEIPSNGYYILDPDITFDELAIWNSTQGTGTRPIIVVSDNLGEDNNQLNKITEDYSRIRFHKQRRMWNFNEVKDLIGEDCGMKPLLIRSNPCQVIPDINEGLFDCSKMSHQDMKGRLLDDKYMNYRFTFKNRNGIRLRVIYLVTIDDAK